MPAYAYPIKINYKRERKPVNKTVDVSNCNSWGDLKKLLNANANDNDGIDFEVDEYCIVNITSFRPETDEEMQSRIARGEKYMEEYNKRRKK